MNKKSKRDLNQYFNQWNTSFYQARIATDTDMYYSKKLMKRSLTGLVMHARYKQKSRKDKTIADAYCKEILKAKPFRALQDYLYLRREKEKSNLNWAKRANLKFMTVYFKSWAWFAGRNAELLNR